MLGKEAVEQLKFAMDSNSLVLFEGAGVSVNSGLPTWSDLISELKQELDVPENQGNLNSLKIAQIYYDIWGQQRYNEKIRGVFEKYGNARPNEIHRLVREISPRHIITTNYDTLIEQSLSDSITRYDVIRSDTDIPYSNSDHYLIKMHGDFKTNNFVLKEDDYLNYEQNFQLVSTLIKALLLNNTVLFIGYGLGDSTFNAIFNLIQTLLQGDAKKAYFFSTDEMSESEIRYYENKGIFVINQSDFGFKNLGKGESNIEFLNLLEESVIDGVSDSKTLDKRLSDIKSIDFLPTSDLFNLLRFQMPDVFVGRGLEIDCFNPEKTINISKYALEQISKQTAIKKFLGMDISKEQSFQRKGNYFLSDGVEKVLSGEDARAWFRKKANESYQNKDYWHFLIAEYNLTRLESRGFLEPDSTVLDEPIYGNLPLKEVVDNLISNGSSETVEIAKYFRDVVLNFKFVYRTLEGLTEKLNKIKSERLNYKSGGWSMNSTLFDIWVEFYEFYKFVMSNGITVFNYREFKTVVNLYMESAVLAFEIHEYQNLGVSKRGAEGTASQIKELELENIQLFLEFGNVDELAVWMDLYDVNQLVLTGQAEKYLLEMLSHTSDERSFTNEVLKILKFVKVNDVESLLKQLNNISVDPMSFIVLGLIADVLHNNIKEIKKLTAVENTSISNLINVIIGLQLRALAAEETATIQQGFSKIMNALSQLEIQISLPDIIDGISLVKYLEQNKDFTPKYLNLLLMIVDKLSSSERADVNQLLKRWAGDERQVIADRNLIDLVIAGIEVPSEKLTNTVNNMIYEVESWTIENRTNNVDVRREEYIIGGLFNLYTMNALSDEQILKVKEFSIVEGIIPEYDWKVLNKRDRLTIKRLMRRHNYDHILAYFADTKADKQLIDTWVLEEFAKGNLRDISKVHNG